MFNPTHLKFVNETADAEVIRNLEEWLCILDLESPTVSGGKTDL